MWRQAIDVHLQVKCESHIQRVEGRASGKGELELSDVISYMNARQGARTFNGGLPLVGLRRRKKRRFLVGPWLNFLYLTLVTMWPGINAYRACITLFRTRATISAR